MIIIIIIIIMTRESLTKRDRALQTPQSNYLSYGFTYTSFNIRIITY